MNSELWCSNMEASFWPADWVFISYLTLAEGLSHTGPLSHGEIRLALLLNNSVDFFYWLTIPLRLQESREQPFLKQIVFPLLLTFFFCYAEVTEPQLLKSSILSFYSLHSHLPHPCAATKQSAPKSLHFYSYKYRFRAPCTLQIHSQSGPLTDSFPLYIQTITKSTSAPLIDSNH